jgi:hypothetical protein
VYFLTLKKVFFIFSLFAPKLFMLCSYGAYMFTFDTFLEVFAIFSKFISFN